MYRNSAYSRMKSPALTPRWFTRFKNALLLVLLQLRPLPLALLISVNSKLP